MPKTKKYASNDDEWRAFLTGEHEALRRHRKLFSFIPSEPRCKFCNAPFGRPGKLLMHLLYGKSPSTFNPMMCNM